MHLFESTPCRKFDPLKVHTLVNSHFEKADPKQTESKWDDGVVTFKFDCSAVSLVPLAKVHAFDVVVQSAKKDTLTFDIYREDMHTKEDGKRQWVNSFFPIAQVTLTAEEILELCTEERTNLHEVFKPRLGYNSRIISNEMSIARWVQDSINAEQSA